MMKLRVMNGKPTFGSLFKLIFLGTLFGSLLIAALVIFSLGLWMTAEEEEIPIFAIMWQVLLIAPILMLFQTAIFAGLCTFGLWVYDKRWPITIRNE